jgi:hypothetical protein
MGKGPHQRSGLYGQVWDMSVLERVGKGMTHSYIANTAKFSPDGNLVLTVQGTTGQVWDAATGEPIGGPLMFPPIWQ